MFLLFASSKLGEPFILTIVIATTTIYALTNFKFGIYDENLNKHDAMFSSLIKVDCYFGQDLLSKAITQQAMKLDHCYEQYILPLISEHKDADTIFSLTTYKIRVMLAHARIKYDTKKHVCDTTFLYMLPLTMKEMSATKAALNDPRSDKRDIRLGQMPNPFINIRKAPKEDTADDDEDFEIPKEAATFYDGKTCIAMLLMDDGDNLSDGIYEEGANIVAKWVQQMELEIRNSCLKNCVIEQYKPMSSVKAKVAEAKTTMTKPATKLAEDDVKDGEGEDDELLRDVEQVSSTPAVEGDNSGEML